METNLNKMKEQAEINAFKRLQHDFSTPEQLEQIEQHINRNEKKKVDKRFKIEFNRNKFGNYFEFIEHD
jgi:hypothetical protein